ncbi:nucleolar protein nop5 [Niveomyces insectorum RCEF 264]|uniref:Nucleolar protein 58 n=1 Tax=Niveomyces insectorum RCEF 264 TaxID=1081102 RepID=A0A167TT26_9HYPO|nr:nucleolar protein nop5 [Niveomyces insectorum RCEF 264]
MPLFVLAETSAGYGLFKAKDKKLLERDDLSLRISSTDKIHDELKLKEFLKWDSASAALSELDKLVDGKVPPLLMKLLDSVKDEKKLSLAVADKSLGNALQKLPGFNITAVTAAPGSLAGEVYRGIRQHLAELIPGIDDDAFKTMSLGLSHSLSRHKLKFSADKVDVMIIQAVALLDDLDKELNTYAMRVKEWYGWHFPELGKILNDNLAYARVILAIGMRENIEKADLSEVLPEEIETAVKAAADVSMGTEIAEEDLENIKLLAEQVVTYTEYRVQLAGYLESRMKAIAPNLTEIVGFLVGARLIAHTGSLMNLAKSAGSTIQIIGAEKALFRALKTKHSTPKYGLIYHSSLVGQATGRNKGKIARQLSAKAAISVRTDALAEFDDDEEDDVRAALGISSRAKLEQSLRRLEGKPLAKAASSFSNGVGSAPGKWEVKEARKYNVDADGLTGDEPAAAINGDEDGVVSKHKKDKKEKKDKKAKKDKKTTPAAEETQDVTMAGDHEEAATNGTSSGPRKLSEEDYERYAEAAGISVSKFKRKYERGDVELGEDGRPIVHSKKELKKRRKSDQAQASEEAAGASKRKRDEESETPKKKKKRHSTA